MARLRQHLARSLRPTATAEGDQVTTLELFFDLVYAFAFTQVTALMAHGEAPGSVLDGIVVLSLLWFSWCSFTWLANQARPTGGIVRIAFVVAMAAVFLACLALPDAFHPAAHALDGALVVVACYAVVRVTHATVYLVSARGDRSLQRQVSVTVGASLIPTMALLVTGAVVGEPEQRWIWLAAVLYDFASVFVTANLSRGWVIQSAGHFAERHGLIVILALGESIIAVATGLGGAHLTAQVAVGAVASLLVVAGLFLAYFDHLPEQLEAALGDVDGPTRARLGTDVFTYLHFPMIVGVIITALGVEQAMGHLEDPHLGVLGGLSLGVGITLFLVGTMAALVRSGESWPIPRCVLCLLLLCASPVLAVAAPLLSLGLAALPLIGLAATESLRRAASPSTLGA